MKVSDLQPNPQNPRKITDPQLRRLKKSLEKFGDLSGIVFNKRTGHIVGGHQRLKVLPAEAEILDGFIQVEGNRFTYREVDWDEDTEKAANLAANKHGGDWDKRLLADWLIDLDSKNYDLDLTGFTAKELEDICAPFYNMPVENEDDVPPIPKEARSRLGDVFRLGDHRLACADSTDSLLVDKLMGDEIASLVFTDPPYGVDYVGKTKEALTIENDQQDEASLLILLQSAFAAWPLKPGGVFYVCSPAGHTELIFRQALPELREAIVWVKQQFVMGRQDYHWRHESILYGWRKGAAHYFVDDRTQDTVWSFDRPRSSQEHPTMKPVELIEKALHNSSLPGEIVFDGFSGSGSTLIACEKRKRKCRAMEIDPIYCDVIISRWEKFSGQKAELIT